MIRFRLFAVEALGSIGICAVMVLVSRLLPKEGR